MFWTRHDFDANVTMRDLVDSYMPAFQVRKTPSWPRGWATFSIDVLTPECNLTPLSLQSCVEKGRVSGLMCSYNAINGVHSCGNSWLLQTVARESWGFDGYVTSDCDADADVYNKHHYYKTPEETVAGVLKAGTDVDCTSFVGKNAQSALDKGLIDEAEIDKHLAVLMKVRIRLGHFDPVGPQSQESQ